MKNIFKTIFFSFSITLFLGALLTSCGNIEQMTDVISLLVQNITSVGDFFKVYIVIQLSIFIDTLIFGLLISLLFHSNSSYIVYIFMIIIHFIWIVTNRDYGFFIVLLLFSLFTIILWIYSYIRGIRRNPRN